MNRPVIFISNFHPFTTRNVFDTGVLDKIAKESERVVAFVPIEKESYMKERYEKGNIIIHGIEDSLIAKGKKTVIFYRVAELFLDTKTKRDHQLKYLAASSRWYRQIKYYLTLLVIRTLGNILLAKKLYRVVEGSLHHPENFYKYFEEYKPDMVFLTDIFAEIDTLLAMEARQRGIMTKALVRSWDNTTNKTLLRVVPDKFIVQNETMKKDLVTHHAITPERIAVVGVPQFEYYLFYAPKSREEFCKEMSLNPKKRIVLFSPGGSKYTLTDWQICEILKRLQAEGKIPKDVQFLVRLHPQNFTDLSKFEPNENFIIDDPGVGLKTDRAKEFELGKIAVHHLADSLYHSDLVLNVVSSIVVDAAIFDKPVVTVGFNGWEKSVPYLKSVERVQSQEWLQVLNDNKGIAPTAHTPEELAALLKDALNNPKKYSVERKRFVEHHCYKFDGRTAERMAKAVLHHEK